MSMIKEYLDSLRNTINELPEDSIQDVIETLKGAHEEGRQVFLLGNGGSASTASHVACDLQKGVKMKTGKRLMASAINDSVPLLTSWANDTDYENIFSEQLDSLLRPGDVVIALSGSGNSPNILKAVEKANDMGAITIGWSGFGGGRLAQIAQKSLVVNSNNMQRVEDVHMILGHVISACLMSQSVQSR